MAVREGKCANCGSLISFDSSQDQARCVFCWAQTDAHLAQELLKNDEGHVYPNETYEMPDEEERFTHLRKVQGQPPLTKKQNQVQPKKKKTEGPSAVERVKAMNKVLVRVPKVTARQWMILSSIILAVVLVFCAITIPLWMNRKAKRIDLTQAIVAALDLNEDARALSIEGQKNDFITLVFPEDLTEDKASQIAQQVRGIYQQVYGLEKAEDVRIRLKLLSEKQSYQVDWKDGAERMLALSDRPLATQDPGEATKESGTATEIAAGAAASAAESATAADATTGADTSGAASSESVAAVSETTRTGE